MGFFRSKWYKYVCLALGVVFVYIYIQVYSIFSYEDMSINLTYGRIQPMKNIQDGVLLRQLLEVTTSLNKAKLHARGTKTSDEIRHAINILDNILETFRVDKDQSVKRDIKESKSVCPETYMGTTYGYPLYDKGFEVINCSHAKPLSQIVTILIYIEDADTHVIKNATDRFTNSLRSIANITAIIATKPKYEPMEPSLGNVRYLDVTAAKHRGDCWNMLISEAHTPYVLIARDVDVMTTDSRLERLVRAIEIMQVPVAAGALRYPDGHWDKGCYQSAHRNYTLRYLKGYDESHQECLFCDYIDGPFVATVESIKAIPFTHVEIKSGLFEDWFLQLNKKSIETVVCPDSMFHVKYKSGTTEEEELLWNSFMAKWDLYKLMFSSGKTIISNCSNMGYWKSSRAVTPCRLNANAYAINCILNVCEKESIICQLSEGTLLGAVKFGKVIPWDYDADLDYLKANRSIIFGKIQDHCRKYNFVLTNYYLFFTIKYKTWSIDITPLDIVDAAIMLAKGMNATKILFDGHWFVAPRNPGLVTRNRYGPEIYKHAVHWRVTRSWSAYTMYESGTFPRCDDPGRHDCLDHFNGDGNLQFLDPLP